MTITLACETARSRTLDVRGLRLHYLESGRADAPALCFLHGGAAHAHWFDRVTPTFASQFRVIALDQRGHGESAWAEPPAYGTADFTGDLLALMDHLGLPRMAVVGHSMGGHNAMTFAAWHPERVSALGIIDSRPAIPAERLQFMHARGRRMPRAHASEDAAVAAFRLLPRETAADPAFLAHLARAGMTRRNGGWGWRFDPATHGSREPVDAWPLLSHITAPTLIARGGLSPILPPDMADRLHAGIANSTLITIPGAYHHLTLDRPAEFAAELQKFLTPLLSRHSAG